MVRIEKVKNRPVKKPPTQTTASPTKQKEDEKKVKK